jgi:ABC-type Fe3+/spermidine/putrescine transport system ATPase subunit
MDHGRIAQIGTPHEVYDRPNSRFVADFIGDANLIEGVVADGIFRAADLALPMDGPAGPALASVRPERIGLDPPGAGPAGRIESATYLGSRIEYGVATGFGAILVSVPVGETSPLAPGAAVTVTIRHFVRTRGETAG